MVVRKLPDFSEFKLSSTFGTPYETEKDRAKREIMERMPSLQTNDEVIIVDPDAEMTALKSKFDN